MAEPRRFVSAVAFHFRPPPPHLTLIPLPPCSERRLVVVDRLVGVQRALRPRRAEADAHLHQPDAAQRRGVLRGHVGAEEHLQHLVPR